MSKLIGFIVTTQNSKNEYNVSSMEIGDLENNVYETILNDIQVGNTTDLLQFISSKYPNETVVEFEVIENGFSGTMLDSTLVAQ